MIARQHLGQAELDGLERGESRGFVEQRVHPFVPGDPTNDLHRVVGLAAGARVEEQRRHVAGVEVRPRRCHDRPVQKQTEGPHRTARRDRVGRDGAQDLPHPVGGNSEPRFERGLGDDRDDLVRVPGLMSSQQARASGHPNRRLHREPFFPHRPLGIGRRMRAACTCSDSRTAGCALTAERWPLGPGPPLRPEGRPHAITSVISRSHRIAPRGTDRCRRHRRYPRTPVDA